MSQISVLTSKRKNQLNPTIKRRINKKIKILFTIFVVVMVMVFIYVATKKNPDEYGDVSRLEFFVKSIANYSNVSSAAFVEWYKGGFSYTYGEKSFRFIYAFLNAIGLEIGTVSVNYGGLFIKFENISTNAFTVARNYVEDFGVLYMAFVLYFFGIIHGWVYGKVINSKGLKLFRYSLLNSMLFIPLFYQILTDQYFNVLSQWIQITIWICLFTSNRHWKRFIKSNPN